MGKPNNLIQFTTIVVGVTFRNDDGTDRQAIVAKCYVGERLFFIHDVGNPHDAHAVQVRRASREIVGHLPRETAKKVVRHSRNGFRFTAYVDAKTGGTCDKPTLGLVLDVTGERTSEADASEPAEAGRIVIHTEGVTISDGYRSHAGPTSLAMRQRHRTQGCVFVLVLLGAFSATVAFALAGL